MDAGEFLERMMLGGPRGSPKREFRTRRVFGKKIEIGGPVHSGALVVAARLAVGAYEAWKGRGGNTLPPPPSEPEAPPAMEEPVRRLVRLMISAARADGDIGPGERERILSEARAAGAEELVARELASPVPLAEIVGDVTDPSLKEQLYTLAFTIVRAEGDITGGEKVYLFGLAHQLGLDPATISRLEAAATASIDIGCPPCRCEEETPGRGE